MKITERAFNFAFKRGVSIIAKQHNSVKIFKKG